MDGASNLHRWVRQRVGELAASCLDDASRTELQGALERAAEGCGEEMPLALTAVNFHSRPGVLAITETQAVFAAEAEPIDIIQISDIVDALQLKPDPQLSYLRLRLRSGATLSFIYRDPDTTANTRLAERLMASTAGAGRDSDAHLVPDRAVVVPPKIERTAGRVPGTLRWWAYPYALWMIAGGAAAILVQAKTKDGGWYGYALGAALVAYGIAVIGGFVRKVAIHPLTVFGPPILIGILLASPK